MMTACPVPYSTSYCFNGGECIADYADPGSFRFHAYCRCAQDYHGRRCEYLVDSSVYGFKVERGEASILAVSTLVTIIIFILVLCCCCLYLYWKFGRDRSDYSPQSVRQRPELIV